MTVRLYWQLVLTILVATCVTQSWGQIIACNGGTGSITYTLSAQGPPVHYSEKTSYVSFYCSWVFTAPEEGYIEISHQVSSEDLSVMFMCSLKDGDNVFLLGGALKPYDWGSIYGKGTLTCTIYTSFPTTISLTGNYYTDMSWSVPTRSSGGEFYLDKTLTGLTLSTASLHPGSMKFTSSYFINSPPGSFLRLDFPFLSTGLYFRLEVLDSSFNSVAVVSGVDVRFSPITMNGNKAHLVIGDLYDISSRGYSTTTVKTGITVNITYTDRFEWDNTTVLSSCGGFLQFDDSSPSIDITTPGYNNSAPSTDIYYIMCAWYCLKPTASNKVWTTDILDFQTKGYYFEVYSGTDSRNGTTVARLMGEVNLDRMPHFTYDENYLILKMISDDSGNIQGRGVKARVQSVDSSDKGNSSHLTSCGGQATIDDVTSSVFISPPDFLAANNGTGGGSVQCFWHIDGGNLQLNYKGFAIEGPFFPRSP